MIIDRTKLAGLDAYFQVPNNAGQINLAGQVTSRTKPLEKGKQLEISAIQLLIESDSDLTNLFNASVDNQASPPALEPLFSVVVMKQMFPSLFAEPFRHRVHNIAGFEDFKQGTLENGKVMEIDGVPTIVSIGTGTCKWVSAVYRLPDPVALTQASWDLAVSRKTPKENFKYALKLHVFDAGQSLIQTVHLTNRGDPAQPAAPAFDPTSARTAQNLNSRNVAFYQVEFTADVNRDTSIYEKHTGLVGQSIGTPLLRAVNLLEPVESIYDICSLQELLSLSSDYHLFECQGQPIKKMIATLNFSATLVHSEYQSIANNDPNDPNSLYEFVEIAVKTDQFSNLEAKLVSDVLAKPKIK
jgi:hypothetical protein